MSATAIQNISVIGLGTIGHSVVQMFATADCRVRCFDPSLAVRDGLEGRIRGNLSQMVDANLFIQEDVELFGRWEYSTIGRINFAPANNTLNVMTLGINYWLDGVKNLKWTTDFGYAFTGIAGRGTTPRPAGGDYASSGNGWNADPNDGQWLVRTQLQLLF